MRKKWISLLLCVACLLSLAACGRTEPPEESTPPALAFRETVPNDTGYGNWVEPLTEEEMRSILPDAIISGMSGSITLLEDDTLSVVSFLRETDSQVNDTVVIPERIEFFPALPETDFQPTCEVFGTPVDVTRGESSEGLRYAAVFVREDSGVAVKIRVFCRPEEGDTEAGCLERLRALTEACLNPENTLTLDSVYAGPDFPRQSETALVPLSLETEAALRAGAGEAMEQYLAACAEDPVLPAEAGCDSVMIRAVNPEGDQMLLDARMVYRPEHWNYSDVDDAFRFLDDLVPTWYSGQPVLDLGEGERAGCLVGKQSFRAVRGEDGHWRFTEDIPGGATARWLDSGSGSYYADWTRVRWTV